MNQVESKQCVVYVTLVEPNVLGEDVEVVLMDEGVSREEIISTLNREYGKDDWFGYRIRD